MQEGFPLNLALKYVVS